MKKLLSIIVLSLLFSGCAYAELTGWEKEAKIGDPNKNIILISTEDYIVIKNTTANSKIEVKVDNSADILFYTSASVFGEEALRHCKKNPQYNEVIRQEAFDDHTAYYFCDKSIEKSLATKDENFKIFWFMVCKEWEREGDTAKFKKDKCKKKIKKAIKEYPNILSVYAKKINRDNKFEDSSFIFDIKKRALAKKEESKKIEMMVMIDEAKATCKLIGIKEETQQFSDCALKLYIKSIDNVAQEKQTIVHTQVNTTSGNSSSGNNSMTIYDPVRDNNALIKRGQGLLTGSCTVANLSNC
tara:strand:- start:21 stop:917 length:897 start_codon:yes stop_codon:yes gene_type:complete